MVGVATAKLRELKHGRTRGTDSKLESDERKLRELRLSLPDFASSHWVHSLCLDFFVCHCLVCACILYYCNMVR